MTERDLERRLARALDHAAPNDLDGVLSRCEMRKGNVISMKKTMNGRYKKLIAACLALILIGGGSGVFYQQSYAVASVVSLDVNPSIELKVNRNEKVISCAGLNEQAGKILADMDGGADLKGTKLNVAVNAIVGSLVGHGYLEDISSAILISVEDKDQTRAVRLQQELTAAVDTVLQEKAAQASVLSQTVQQNAALTQQAAHHHISTGKANLVNQVLANNKALSDDDVTREALSALSVEELRDLSHHADIHCLPVDKSQVAQDVIAYAGLTDRGSVSWTVDPELDERTPCYEVELRYSGKEYDYTVDAFTGAILTGPKDVLSGQTGPAAGRIGGEAAFNAAAADFYARYPELSGCNIFDWKTVLDWDDDGPAPQEHYDVEFWVNGYEVEYAVDAYTGAILGWDTEYEGPVLTHHDDPHHQIAGSDIGRDAAKAAALKHAGLSESQVTRLKVEEDWEHHGRLEYEVEFKSGGMEYEYTIDGITGAVLEHEKDWDDDL